MRILEIQSYTCNWLRLAGFGGESFVVHTCPVAPKSSIDRFFTFSRTNNSGNKTQQPYLSSELIILASHGSLNKSFLFRQRLRTIDNTWSVGIRYCSFNFIKHFQKLVGGRGTLPINPTLLLVRHNSFCDRYLCGSWSWMCSTSWSTYSERTAEASGDTQSPVYNKHLIRLFLGARVNSFHDRLRRLFGRENFDGSFRATRKIHEWITGELKRGEKIAPWLIYA